MKIVMLQDFFGNDYEYQENLLTQHYIRAGHEVTVIASTFESVFDYIADNYNSNLTAKTYTYYGAKIIKLPYSFNLLNKLRRHNGVYEILIEEKPDLIYLHDIHLNIVEAAKYIKKNSSCRMIMDYHSDFSNSANHWLSLPILHKVIRKTILHRYLKFIDAIFPVVPGSVEFLNKVYDIHLDKMEILPLGCDYEKCVKIKAATDRELKRGDLGISPSDLVIITGGKFNPSKKIEIAIEVIKNIKRTDVHLIIFGAPEKGHEKYAEELYSRGNIKNIHFTGYAKGDKSYELMAISDVAFFPASQSVLWQQSIGMQLPLIAGDSGDQDMSYLNKNDNVIKVDTQNLNSEYFTNIFLQVINNRSKLDEMKKGAEKTAKEYLDYKVICERTLKAYKSQ